MSAFDKWHADEIGPHYRDDPDYHCQHELWERRAWNNAIYRVMRELEGTAPKATLDLIATFADPL